MLCPPTHFPNPPGSHAASVPLCLAHVTSCRALRSLPLELGGAPVDGACFLHPLACGWTPPPALSLSRSLVNCRCCPPAHCPTPHPLLPWSPVLPPHARSLVGRSSGPLSLVPGRKADLQATGKCQGPSCACVHVTGRKATPLWSGPAVGLSLCPQLERAPHLTPSKV